MKEPSLAVKAFRLGCGCVIVALCAWLALVGLVTSIFVGGLSWDHYGPHAEYWKEAD